MPHFRSSNLLPRLWRLAACIAFTIAIISASTSPAAATEWSAPESIDPVVTALGEGHDDLAGASCASASFCVAVDQAHASAHSKCASIKRKAHKTHGKKARERLMTRYRRCRRGRHRGHHKRHGGHRHKGHGEEHGAGDQAQQRANQEVQKLIGNLELSRSTSEEESHNIYCANGMWEETTFFFGLGETSGSRIEGKRWWVVGAHLNGSEFTAGLFAESAHEHIHVSLIRKRSDGHYEYLVVSGEYDASEADAEYLSYWRQLKGDLGKPEGWGAEATSADATEKCAKLG